MRLQGCTAGMTALSLLAPHRTGIQRRHWKLPAAQYALLLPLILYVPIMYGYPIAYNVLVSFEDFTMHSVVTGHADFVGLKNLITVLRDPVTVLAIRNTAIFTVTSLLFQYVIGMALALLFVRRFPLNTFLRAVLLLPWLLPSIASVTAWLWLFDGMNGLLNYLLMEAHILSRPVGWVDSPETALSAIIIVNVWIGIPFNLVILYSGMQAIPRDLYEAAEIDGARGLQRFLYITLPNLAAINAILLMLGLIHTLKQFDIIYILTQGGPGNATQVLSTWSYFLSFRSMKFGQGAAVGDIMLVISLVGAIWYAFFTRREISQ